ncbi:MAG: FHA domain-containing protein [Bacteriovoracia bacterium]
MVVKIYERDSAMPAIHKIDHFPCSIGRSMRNGIVLAHASVSKEHARVELRSEGIFLVDVSRTNGILLHGQKVSEVSLERDTTVYFGGVRLDFIVDEAALEPTHDIVLPATPEMYSAPPRPARVEPPTARLALHLAYRFSWRNWLGLGAALALMLVAFGLDYFSSPYESQWGDLVVTGIMTYLVSAIAAFGVAIFSKIHVKRYQFVKIWAWVTLGLAAFEMVSIFRSFVLFNLPEPFLQRFVGYLTVFLILSVVLNGLAGLLFAEVARERRRAIVMAVCGLIVGLGVLVRNLSQLDEAQFEYYGAISVPIWGYTSEKLALPHALEALDASVGRLQTNRKKTEDESPPEKPSEGPKS